MRRAATNADAKRDFVFITPILRVRVGADKSILTIAQAQNAQIFVGRLCQTPTPGRFTETPYKSSCSLAVFGRSAFARGYGGRSSLRFALRFKRRLERVTRLELATSTLARWCSTN